MNAPDIQQVGAAVEDEVGDAGVFLLAAVPEGELRPPTGARTGRCLHVLAC